MKNFMRNNHEEFFVTAIAICWSNNRFCREVQKPVVQSEMLQIVHIEPE